MRITIPLLLALGLAACADEPTEEERAAAVAEVEAHQTPPPEQLEPGAIRYREIEEYDLYGAGCSFAPAGGGVAAVAHLHITIIMMSVRKVGPKSVLMK